MLQVLGYLSGLVSAFCYLPYIRDILKLKTKPERASWFIWSVLGGIAFSSQLAKGASDSLWLTGVQTLGVLIVFLLSLKYGAGGFSKWDYAALSVAAIGLIAWYLTREAAVALFIVILVDAAGGSLTVHKAYKDPGSETLITWVLSGISGFLAILAVGSLDFVLLSYPIYIFLINMSVVLAMYLGSKSSTKQVKK